MIWETLTTQEKIDVWLTHFMFIGQTLFLATWAVMPWWKEWIGRSLMVKSFALWLLIAFGLFQFWWMMAYGNWPFNGWISLATHVLITVGIWSQVFAIAYEKRVGYRQREMKKPQFEGELGLPPSAGR